MIAFVSIEECFLILNRNEAQHFICGERKEKKTRLSLLYCYITTAVKNGKHIRDLQNKLFETEVLQLIAAFFIVNNLTFRKKIQIANICLFRYLSTRAKGAFRVQGVIARL